MAYIGYEFNANEVEPAAPMEVVPPGEYVVHIKNSEMKDNKAGTGQYLQLDVEIAEGEWKNRRIFARLNLDNPNPTAVEIANRELSSICHAIGVMKVRDSSQLHHKKLIAKVDVEKREKYDPQNVIKNWKPLEGGDVPAPAETDDGSEAPAVKKPSWAK